MCEKRLTEEMDDVYDKYKTQIDVCLEGVDDNMREEEKKRIICDLIDVKANSDFSASEYFMYDFAHKNRSQQSTFLTEKATYEMFYQFNDDKSLDYNTRDKWKVYRQLNKYYRREICCVTDVGQRQAFFSMLKEKQRLFCKPLCGSLGEKVRIIKADDFMNAEAFFELLQYYSPEGFLAEEIIEQTEFMKRLNPTSINTLRIMSIRMDNRICMYFEMRIGEMFSIADNLGLRSLICGINPNDGTIISAYNKNRTSFVSHPHTRAKIVGEKIPRFFEAVELAKELAGYYPGFRYLSWDLALTDEGWVIVELNGKGGICGFQEVYNCGIRHDIEGYLAELDKSISGTGLLDEGYVLFESGEACPHAEYSFKL